MIEAMTTHIDHTMTNLEFMLALMLAPFVLEKIILRWRRYGL